MVATTRYGTKERARKLLARMEKEKKQFSEAEKRIKDKSKQFKEPLRLYVHNDEKLLYYLSYLYNLLVYGVSVVPEKKGRMDIDVLDTKRKFSYAQIVKYLAKLSASKEQMQKINSFLEKSTLFEEILTRHAKKTYKKVDRVIMEEEDLVEQFLKDLEKSIEKSWQPDFKNELLNLDKEIKGLQIGLKKEEKNFDKEDFKSLLKILSVLDRDLYDLRRELTLVLNSLNYIKRESAGKTISAISINQTQTQNVRKLLEAVRRIIGMIKKLAYEIHYIIKKTPSLLEKNKYEIDFLLRIERDMEKTKGVFTRFGF